MSVIKINAITVPADSGDELARRFAARGESIKDTPGFQGYELLKPTDGRNVWLVMTRWDSDEAFENWKNSAAFARSHSGVDGAGQGHPHGAGHGGGHAAGHGESQGHPHGAGHGDAAGGRKPVGTSAELWEYTVAVKV